ncbi:MAG: hypothetical protein ACI4MM_08625 [Candidatus Ventricola sp.]
MENKKEANLMFICEAVKAMTDEDAEAQKYMLRLVQSAYDLGGLDKKTEKSA